MTLHALCGLLALVLVGQGSTIEWSGTCCRVLDGDTIRVKGDDGTRTVRLYGIDCPEGTQPFACEATYFTCKAACGKKVRIREMDTDKHGRTVARVWVGGRLLNRELVRAGMAWWYRKYAPEDRDIAAVEEQARKNKRGLWRAGDPVPPWLFRWKSQEE